MMSSQFVVIKQITSMTDELEVLPDGELETLNEAIGGYITYMPSIHFPNKIPWRNKYRKLLNVILDEDGMMKNLPFNDRAYSIIGGAYPVYGDAVFEIGEVVE